MEINNFISFIKNNKGVTILIFSIVFISGLAVSYNFSTFSTPKIFEQEVISRSLLKGEGFSYKYDGVKYYSFIAPLTVYVFFLIHKFFGPSALPILFFQYGCTFLMGISLVYFVRKHLTSSTSVSVFVGIMCVINPVLVYYESVNLHYLPLLTLIVNCFLLMVFNIFKYFEVLSLKEITGYGLFLGIVSLERPTVLQFALCSALLLLWIKHKALKRSLMVISVLFFSSLLAMSPWFIRNYFVYEGKHIFHIQSSKWLFFYRGNNLSAIGSEYNNINKEIYWDKLTDEEKTSIRSGDEFQADDVYKKLILKDIKIDPARFIRLCLNKIFYFFWFSPTSGLEYPYSYLKYAKMYYFLFYCTLVYGIYHFWRFQKDKTFLVLSLLMVISFAVAQSFFYVSLRHRIATEPLLYIITFLPIGEKFSSWFKRIKS